MVEAIVAAMLLVIVALGVLKGLDTAQQSSGREKARSTAAALTEQDQERLRSFRAVDLANYDETRDDQRQQRRLHGPVAGRLGPRLDRRHAELQQQRDAGRLHADHLDDDVEPGQHADRADQDVEPRRSARRRLRHQPGHARHPGQRPRRRRRRGRQRHDHRADHRTNPTNSAGCAIFAYVPVGAYTAKLDTAGWVDKGGNQNTTVGATVSQGTVNVKTLDYDQAASVDGIFDTETARRRHGARHDARSCRPPTPACPPAPSRPFAGERVWDPTGGARRHDLRRPASSPSPTATTSTAAAAPARTRRRTTPTTSRPTRRELGRRRRSRPGVAGDQGPDALDQPARALQRRPAGRGPPAVHAHPRHLDEHELHREVQLRRAPSDRRATAGCSSRRSRSAPTRCAPSRARRRRRPSLRKKEITGVKNFYYRGMKLPDVASPVIDLNSGDQQRSMHDEPPAHESGVTLVELIVAMMIGDDDRARRLRVLDTSVKQSTKVAGRVNATQRGRIAMDTITRQLRSQVCYSATVPALVSGHGRRREVPRRPDRRREADRAARDRLQRDGAGR